MASKTRKQRPTLPEDLGAFVSHLDKESDRGSALIAGALLDAQLEDLFRRRLKAHHEELLTFEGPLATFASRIKVAKALEWIDDAVEADLNVIRDIRNYFAHSFDHQLGFEDSRIAGWCSSLRTMNAHLAAYDQAKERLHRNYSLDLIAAWRAVFEPPRRRYLCTVHFIAQHLKEAADTGGNQESLTDAVTKLGMNFGFRVQAVATVSTPNSPQKPTGA